MPGGGHKKTKYDGACHGEMKVAKWANVAWGRLGHQGAGKRNWARGGKVENLPNTKKCRRASFISSSLLGSVKSSTNDSRCRDREKAIYSNDKALLLCPGTHTPR